MNCIDTKRRLQCSSQSATGQWTYLQNIHARRGDTVIETFNEIFIVNKIHETLHHYIKMLLEIICLP